MGTYYHQYGYISIVKVHKYGYIILCNFMGTYSLILIWVHIIIISTTEHILIF
nr:MAG TPA: hypothetical protein [Caudoviricetes sp.]